MEISISLSAARAFKGPGGERGKQTMARGLKEIASELEGKEMRIQG
jgi:hypothetical protein